MLLYIERKIIPLIKYLSPVECMMPVEFLAYILFLVFLVDSFLLNQAEVQVKILKFISKKSFKLFLIVWSKFRILVYSFCITMLMIDVLCVFLFIITYE